MKKHIFSPGWTATVCLVVFVPLFVSLGCWQLRRAGEKQAIMDLREHNAQEAPIRFTGEMPTIRAERYRPVTLSGEFDAAHQFLLDNQLLNQQAGYWVMTPLHITGSDRSILVNRGWVPVGKDRSQLPELTVSNTHAQLLGILDQFPGVGFRLKGAEIPGPGWPSVVQLLDAVQLEARLGYPLLPYQVLLAPNQADGYARSWHPPDLNPEKNQGYALQWFSFALTAAILYIWYGFKTNHRMNHPKRSQKVS